VETVSVALIGLGTIGTGVAKILLEHSDVLVSAAGRQVVLAKICDKDITTNRGITLPSEIMTTDIDSVANDKSISVVIELIGGLEPARTFVLKMLRAGKNVITANKALIAQHGQELFDTARGCGRTIAFEAAVCGGIPILGTLMTSLQANRVKSIHAIVNGTCNFILSQMEENGTNYNDAVKEAQRLGYAEANPAMDVDGTDSVQKLTILSQLAFGMTVDWKSIPRTGIEAVDAIDFRYARELGYKIKLLAVADASSNDIELHVSPTLVRKTDPLSRVSDAFNAVRVIGDCVGPVFFHGLGAGRMPTASAIVGDLIDTVLGRTAITAGALQLWNENKREAKRKDPNEFYGKSYLRMLVDDQPGVVHNISGVLGKHKISIASMIQHETTEPKQNGKPPVFLIIATHKSREGDMLEAINEMENISSVHGKVVRMRVLD
jgi:homoserine dehydrogenase